MFRLAGRFLWAWGAGLGGSGPPPPPIVGPYWVSSHYCIGPRCYEPKVREIQVLPGRVWSDDATLMVFAWSEED